MVRGGAPIREIPFEVRGDPRRRVAPMAENLGNLRKRREIIAAYAVALERPEELLRICADTPGDVASAVAAVAEAFDVSDDAAQAILDMQVRRFTPESFVQIRAELAEVDRRIADATA